MATERRFGGTLTTRGAGAREMLRQIRALAQKEILVGYPAETSERKAEEGEEDTGLTNAAIAYVQENGDPDLNIPARPHLGPAIAEISGELVEMFAAAGRAALRDPSPDVVDQRFHRIGTRAAMAVKRKITDGLEPPLADATLRARARRGSKGAKAELESRAQGNAPGTANAKPLIDTGQLRNAVNYVIRNKSERG